MCFPESLLLRTQTDTNASEAALLTPEPCLPLLKRACSCQGNVLSPIISDGSEGQFNGINPHQTNVALLKLLNCVFESMCRMRSV